MKRAKQLTAIFAALAAAVIVIAVFTQDRSFSVKATKVMPLGNWDAASSSYFWLPNSDVLILHRTDLTDSFGNVTYEATEYDPATKHSVDLVHLRQRLSQNFIFSDPRTMQLSPNGQWLLVKGQYGRRMVWAAVTTDGRKIQTFPADMAPREEETALWMPDSRHIVDVADFGGVINAAHLYVQSLDGSPAQEVTHDFMPSYYDEIGFVSSDTGIGVTPRVGDGTVSVVEYQVAPSPKRRAIWMMPVPPDAYGPLQVAVSPRGDRLAWWFLHTPPPLGLNVLNRTLLTRAMTPSERSLWVSNSDGTHMRRLLSLHAADPAPEMLRWTPDGRKISFLYKGALWIASSS